MQSNIHNDEEEPLLTQDDIEEYGLFILYFENGTLQNCHYQPKFSSHPELRINSLPTIRFKTTE